MREGEVKCSCVLYGREGIWTKLCNSAPFAEHEVTSCPQVFNWLYYNGTITLPGNPGPLVASRRKPKQRYVTSSLGSPELQALWPCYASARRLLQRDVEMTAARPTV
jgi:hypothetical protein